MMKLKRKATISIHLITVVFVLFSALIITAVFFRALYYQMKMQIRNEAVSLSIGFNTDESRYLKLIQSQFITLRVTLIKPDGTVLYDSRSDAESMENLSNKPEISSAASVGFGDSERFSKSQNSKNYFYALRLNSGNILRVSGGSETLLSMLSDVLPLLILSFITVFILALILARLLIKLTIKKYIKINPEINGSINESLQGSKAPLSHVLKEPESKAIEFTSILEELSEGFILLDKNECILYANNNAVKIFSGKDTDYTKKNILDLNDGDSIKMAVKTALKGDHFEDMLSVDEQVFMLFSDPMYNDNKTNGAVILIIDITENQKEISKLREFTASMIDELKNPLTTISGYADLLKSGMAAPENALRFSIHIHNETKRLISLADNIVKLLSLDKNNIRNSWVESDLTEIARKVAERISPLTENTSIAVNVTGGRTLINCVPQMIDELIYILVDNAIKYNHEQGRVDIAVTKEDGHPVLSVTDTGIGISEENKDRVFDNFYRVDNYFKNNLDGAGLGLSIAKHIALYHNAKIALDSKPGAGTCVRVIF